MIYYFFIGLFLAAASMGICKAIKFDPIEWEFDERLDIDSLMITGFAIFFIWPICIGVGLLAIVLRILYLIMFNSIPLFERSTLGLIKWYKKKMSNESH